MAQETFTYTNGEVTIVWKPTICQHSGNCVHGLPSVFNTKNRPWIDMRGAETKSIVEQVKKCPSGALSFFFNNSNTDSQ
ncbi:MAG: (4Fe-4S)-binding protein [Bacteroidetes bacterium]|nr:MAG: (4Fe-4S)-binding protein [Bacteroidota bacterium]